MREYRLDFLHSIAGHITHSYPFPAANDAEAIAFAEVWADEAPMELWTDDIRLRRWNRRPSTSSLGR
jgi:hypothetical protein